MAGPSIGAHPDGRLLRHVLRAGGAVQLASGLYLERRVERGIELVALDGRLGEAAAREGLAIPSSVTKA